MHSSIRGAKPSRDRIGVTLLEVLIAIMVLAIGLLGLASLLPVGRWETARANQVDRVATMGRAAFRDLLIRGALSPQNWLYTTGSSGFTSSLNLSATGTISQFAQPPGLSGGSSVKMPFVPVVLDPLMMAINTASQKMVAQFPYKLSGSSNSILSSAPVIPRITLASAPGRNVALPLALADRIFRSTDDFVFSIPDGDKRFKPQGAFEIGIAAVAANVIARRQSEGRISWFATIQPDVSQAVGMVANVTTHGGAAAAVGQGGAINVRQFLVHVAACFNRDLADVSTLNTGNFSVTGERMANIYFPNAAINNSATDAWLWAPISDKDQADQYLTVRADQWIMVTATDTTAVNNPYLGGLPSPKVVLYWYRVRSAASDISQPVDTGGQWSRALRLEGPDWVLPPAGGNVSGYATIVDGLIGVYEKTITTDGASIWSQ
ncbi:MAG TPA: prepilin-type N-terminal cleavage/methylation domain-containing protein [Pirellulales bacterium]|nr:prepilin-type N-terminal cleavage/methylation domain-containing protein [Pirellulales bacterium]